ncbi:hypothetical protein CAEBREN_19194 [Caenorhabditis brenneri]|uniref:Uncharacterized protein n=1 Tax=Caenorhabditis brenneri TaxID=135651 RepID=G0MBI8_CAEBE|nr:hypothetical protein CAEBREN_19194 [Caenorhabditis brenneri]
MAAYVDRNEKYVVGEIGTSKPIANAIGLVTLFAMMRASTEEEIEADRRARKHQLYTEVAIDRSTPGQQQPTDGAPSTSSAPCSTTPPSTSSSSHSALSPSPSTITDESDDDDVIYLKTVCPTSSDSSAPTSKKRTSTSSETEAQSCKEARQL